jgi:hypothetical protein
VTVRNSNTLTQDSSSVRLPTESTTEYMDLMSVGLIIQAAEIVMA